MAKPPRRQIVDEAIRDLQSIDGRPNVDQARGAAVGIVLQLLIDLGHPEVVAEFERTFQRLRQD